MSFFDEVETTVANTRLLQAAEDNQPIVLDLPPFEDLTDSHNLYKERLRVRHLLKPKTLGYYLFVKWMKETVGNGLEYEDHMSTEACLKLIDIHKEYITSGIYDRQDTARDVLNRLLEKPLEAEIFRSSEFRAQITAKVDIIRAEIAKQAAEKEVKSLDADKLEEAQIAQAMAASLAEFEDNRGKGKREMAEPLLEQAPSPPPPPPPLPSPPESEPIGVEENVSENQQNAGAKNENSEAGKKDSREVKAQEKGNEREDREVRRKDSVEPKRPSNARPPLLSEGPGSVEEEAARIKLAAAIFAASSDAHLLDKLVYASMERVPPTHLFDGVLQLMAVVLEPRLSVWMESPHYRRWCQLKAYCKKPIEFSTFRVFRVLGRGAFGAVSAVQKKDTHAIFAMKEMGKKQVKMNQSESMCLNEKKILSKMTSPFVLNLKYAFHTEESLYLIFPMCSGGDLKFHLRNGKESFFANDRAKFYAAEVLLGLEHIHSFDIVYRDLKPNNILLDTQGHVVISDLGLTVKLRKDKPHKHVAGTAGYWAPEILQKRGTFLTSDWWSFGVFLYEMLSGKRPSCKCDKKSTEWCTFGMSTQMETNAQNNGINTTLSSLDFPSTYFGPEATDLLKKLLELDPEKRLGANGTQEIKEHPYFAGIDWEALANKEMSPPFVPDSHTVHANSIGEVGEFNKHKFKKLKITAEDEKFYEGWDWVSATAQEEELLEAIIKQDNPTDTETIKTMNGEPGCCVVL